MGLIDLWFWPLAWTTTIVFCGMFAAFIVVDIGFAYVAENKPVQNIHQLANRERVIKRRLIIGMILTPIVSALLMVMLVFLSVSMSVA